MENSTKKVKTLVANNELEKALDELELFAIRANKKTVSDITILKSNLRDIRNRSNLGIIDHKDEQVSLSKIRLSIINLLESVSKSDEKKSNKFRNLSIYGSVFLILMLIAVFFWINNLSNRIDLNYLLAVVDSPIQQQEAIIIEKGFSGPITIDEGRGYKNYNTDDAIELWEIGIIRFFTSNEKFYLDVLDELENKDEYNFLRTEKNKNNDRFYYYLKESKEIMIGSFGSSQRYLVVIEDSTKQISLKPFISPENIVGSWGRIQKYGEEGIYSFKENYSFIFNHSEAGKIEGTWQIDKRKIILNYNKARNERYSSSPHPLSNKTEIIKIQEYGKNEINAELEDENRFRKKIILRKR